MTTQSCSHRPLATILAALLLLSAIPVAQADTMYWTNSSTAGNFSDPTKWSGGIVPGAGDTAYFTNATTTPIVNWTADATTACADFSTLNQTVTLSIGPSTWYVPNQFVIGADAGRTTTVNLTSGNLVVTNATGTGMLSLSTGPKGTLTLSGGNVQADFVCAGTNATLNLNAGSLTTGHGVTATNAAVTIGATAGKIMTWNMSGGTNQLYSGTLVLGGNAGQTGVVAVTGAGTALMVTNLATLTVGANITGNGQFTVSSNATAYVGTNVTINVNGGGSMLAVLAGGGMTVMGALNVGSGATDSNNTLLVSGTNAILSLTNTMTIGSQGKMNQLIVTNAAVLCGCGTNEFRLGYSASGVPLANRAVVTGAGSVMTNFGLMTIGQQNNGNRFEVTAGGQVFNTNASLALGNNAPGSNNTVVIAGANSAWWTKSLSMAGGWGNQMFVTNGGLLASWAGGTVGVNGSSSNLMVVANGGVWSNANGAAIVTTASANGPGIFNQLALSSSGRVYSTTGTIGNSPGNNSNSVSITDAGSLWSMSGVLTVGNAGTRGNGLLVAQGGQILSVGGTIGSSATNCAASVTNGGSWNASSGAITVGNGAGALSNLLWIDSGAVSGLSFNVGLNTVGAWGNMLMVTNGGQLLVTNKSAVGSSSPSNSAWIAGSGSLLSGPGQDLTIGYKAGYNSISVDGGAVTFGALYAGSGGPASGNTLTITNGAQATFTNRADVGYGGSNSFNNVLLVAAGGLLETANLNVNTGVTGPVSGNTITNAGGIYQFATAAPVIALASNGMVYLTSGTVSFRAVTNADVTCNQSGKPLFTNKMSWSGNNAFRLNAASNTIAASQAYLFDTGLGATNFYRLEMVNGVTRYRGQAGNSLTIGFNGQMLCSNTAAFVDLPYTNNGALLIENSTLSFSTNATLNGSLTLDLNSAATTNGLLLAANLVLTTNGSLNLTGASATNMTLLKVSGTLSGNFGARVTGMPDGYHLVYGTGVGATIALKQLSKVGSVLLLL